MYSKRQVLSVEPMYDGTVYMYTPQTYVQLNPKQTKKLIKALQEALITLKENKHND